MKIRISRWVDNEIMTEDVGIANLISVSFYPDGGGRVDVSLQDSDGIVRIDTRRAIGLVDVSRSTILVQDLSMRESKESKP